MVHTNKVLTVSYGTFSCTLEGFEDSFGTMKAIAEYFRDLAADDRYFGAEPPQPDADMLARIAQREIARRVEAHSDGTAIVLRAQDEVTEPAQPEAPAAPVPAVEETVAAATAAAAVVEDAPVEVEPKVEAVAATVAEEAPEPVAEEPVAEEPALEDVVAEEDVAQDDTPVDDMIDDAVADLVEDEPELDTAPEIAPEIAPEVEPEVEPEIEPEIVAEVTPEVVDEAPEAPAADSIAAKLQRIRDVVARDAAQDAAMAPTDNNIEDTLASDAALLETITEAAAEEDYDEEYEDDFVTEEAPQPVETAEEAPAQAEPAPFNLAAFEAVTAAATEDSYDDEDEDDLAGEDTLFSGLDAPEDALDLDDDEEEMSNILASDTPEEPVDRSGRARVIKVKRADLEAAIARGALESIDGEEDDDGSSLSAEDEADLMRELAEVEAEFGDAPKVHPDEDMPRLLAEAGQKMEEEESAANRETYAQLRAAVAATKAEEKVAGDPKLLSVDKDYRDDLASVVRPDRPMTRPLTRPVSKPLDRGRPTAEIAAPLKLVAEQRVDGSDDSARQPVRPRRVTTELLDENMVTDGAGEDTGGFAVFAEKVGATGLSELLEAAAAYMSYVEGREKFSRPQLMTKVRQVEKEDFNREDGLRSFGQLLREGKIEKAGGGRFTASPDIGFRPDQRAAG